MAHAVTSPPILRLRRSLQSGEKLMTADYVPVYIEDSTHSFFFCGARLDFSTMQAGDSVDVQLLAKLSEDASFTLLDTMTYSGARPSGRSIATVGYLANVYGVEILMRQTAGALRTFPCEFYDAKRLGLV